MKYILLFVIVALLAELSMAAILNDVNLVKNVYETAGEKKTIWGTIYNILIKKPAEFIWDHTIGLLFRL